MELTDKLKGQLGNWWQYLQPFIESEKWDKIFSILKTESQIKKKVIIPDSNLLFKSFELCDSTKVKAIILLMDPYPDTKKINGAEVKVANGVPLDSSNTGILQSSLSEWYGAMTEVYGFNPDMEQKADISYLLSEEHVLMLNSSLTTELMKPGIHAELWREFIEYLFKEVINTMFSGLPIVLCGAQAQRYEKDIDPLRHYILKVEHMAAAAHQNRSWKHGNLFIWVNNILKDNNGPEYQISWSRNRVWQDSTKSSYRYDETKVDPNAVSDLPF